MTYNKCSNKNYENLSSKQYKTMKKIILNVFILNTWLGNNNGYINEVIKRISNTKKFCITLENKHRQSGTHNSIGIKLGIKQMYAF